LKIQFHKKKKTLEFKLDFNLSTQENPIYMLTPNIETITNTVELYKGNPVYRSSAIDPSKTHGIVFTEAPYLGLSILKGPQSKSNEFGGSWEANPTSLGSFPVNAGRRKTNKQLKTEIKEGYGVDQNLISSFVWTNGKQNLRLLKDAYKTRDQKF